MKHASATVTQTHDAHLYSAITLLETPASMIYIRQEKGRQEYIIALDLMLLRETKLHIYWCARRGLYALVEHIASKLGILPFSVARLYTLYVTGHFTLTPVNALRRRGRIVTDFACRARGAGAFIDWCVVEVNISLSTCEISTIATL